MSSNTRVFKRSLNQRSDVQNYNFSEMKSVFNELLSPILNQLSVLSETVTTVLTIVESRCYGDTEKKLNKVCDYTSTSIATDVTMMASSIHKLSKNYETIKEQILENQANMDKFNNKLSNIEKLLHTLVKFENTHKIHDKILEKIFNLEQLLLCSSEPRTKNDSSSHCNLTRPYQVTASVGLDSSMQLITLNNEHDYPSGSWLGDVNFPTCRVRCPISDEDLIYISTRCSTPEKMAVTLLDYLFTRETLAMSNLSGKSKLGKKQLDPLMVYGIKCHLIHHFNITEKQWERIKQNMDSKCRTAWKKRKLVEADITGKVQISRGEMRVKHNKESLIEEDSPGLGGGVMLSGLKAQVIHTTQGDIEVLRATADQILRFHDLHNIHVLDGDHILPVLNTDPDDSDSIIPLQETEMKPECEDNLTIIKADDAVGVEFVTEPMLEVLAEDSLSMDAGLLVEEVSI